MSDNESKSRTLEDRRGCPERLTVRSVFELMKRESERVRKERSRKPRWYQATNTH